MKKLLFALMLSIITTTSFASSIIGEENKEEAKKIVMTVTCGEGYSEESLSMYFDTIEEAEDFYMRSVLNGEFSEFCSISISSTYTHPYTGRQCTVSRNRVNCNDIETVTLELRRLAYEVCTMYVFAPRPPELDEF